jgi:type I restriction enzyme S subunit
MGTGNSAIQATATAENNDGLPEGWASTKLDNLGKWSTGGTPSRKVSSYFGGSIPWVKSGDLVDGSVTTTEETLSKEGLDNSPAKLLPAGTLSIALYGATIGKLGILGLDAATNQACANCQVDQRVALTWFLFYFLLYQRKALVEAGQGGAQPNLTNQIVRQWQIPIPTLPEQNRIVAEVEGLLARVNAARQRLAKVLAILKRFRQSVLAAACSGQLTANWRVDQGKVEPGDGQLPPSWMKRPLSAICTAFEYGSSQKSEKSGKVPVLRMANIQDGEIDWSELVYSNDDEEIEKYSLAPNTVLFNRTNSPELVGKTAIYRGERPAIFAGYLIRIRAAPELDPVFLNLCLNAPSFKEYCLEVRTDGVSQSNINARKLAEYSINWCTLPEQHEIVRRVEALFHLADAIEKRVGVGTARAENLRQAVLAKAFRGELVPTEAELARREGRAYESASALLDRIRTERNAAPSASQKRPARRQKLQSRRR